MTAAWRTPQCFPELYTNMPKSVWAKLGVPPDHENCQGSHSITGVYGGWHCPCPCHKDNP